MTVPTVDVRNHHGAPCVHVNGQPHPGLAFWHWTDERGRAEWELFARCGVHLHQINLSLWPGEVDADDPIHLWDQAMNLLLSADPEARIWIRLTVDPQEWWLKRHPDEAQVHYDQNNGDAFRWRVAYASRAWIDEASFRLGRFVKHMEDRWGERVWCYHLQAGDCGEWSYAWKPVCSGYALSQVAAWREWLRDRYADEADLQSAWRDEAVRLARAEPPTWKERGRHGHWPPPSHLIDPGTDRRVVDWLHFHGSVQAQALSTLAAAMRQALAFAGRRKLIAAFHGYHFFVYGGAYGPCNAGFSDLDPVLHSPDIDVFCTPLSYIHRSPGGVYNHHNLAASLRLHNKMFYIEDDTFTHRAKRTPWRYCCTNVGETLDILRRNVAGAVADGASQWWMDHDSQGWYRDPELEPGIKSMRSLMEASLSYPRGSSAEVVFVVNEASFRILRQEEALIDLLWPGQQAELMRIGAPVDFVRVRDLALAEASGDAARWKFVVVGGCLWLDTQERELLARVLLGGGRHVLFTHGQGITDGQRLDVQLTSALTGIAIETYPHGGPCRAEALVNDAHLAWGTHKTIVPILYANDPQAETLGWLERQYYPALVRRHHPTWTALWSAVPAVPWQLLGALAGSAGVHRYLADGSQVMANRGFVAVHPVATGLRRLRLPQPQHLVDAFSGIDYGTAEELTLDCRRGSTLAWHVRQPADSL